MWKHKTQHFWQPVSADKIAFIKPGDILAPKRPVTKNCLIYTVNSVEFDGKLDLVSKPVKFTSSLVDLVTGTIIKPEDLVNENWWYYVAI